MMRRFCMILAFLILPLCFAGCHQTTLSDGNGEKTDYSVYPKKENVVADRQLYSEGEVQYPSSLWTNVKAKRAVNYDYPLYQAKGYFIEGVEYRGETTSFFAYVGIPETATKENPVPGMVLVHGGGGTAFADWVNYWVGLGYAAISIDTEGRVPALPGATTSSSVHTDSPRHHGPARNGSFLDSKLAVKDQWMYHAIADVIASVSFLSDLPEVDSTKIGCQGVSWGSVIVSGAAKYDDRLAFVVPIYGSIGLSGTPSREGAAIDLQPRAVELWDDVKPLKDCSAPFLFVNSQADHAFSVEVQANCAAPLKYKEFVIIQDLTHNHKQCMAVPEIEVFCDNIVFGDKDCLPQITKQPSPSDHFVETDEERSAVRYGSVFHTSDRSLTVATNWVIDELEESANGKFTFAIPSGTKYFFVSLTDENGYRASSQLIETGKEEDKNS